MARKNSFFFYQPMVVKKRRRKKPRWTILFIGFCVSMFFLDLFLPLSSYFAFVPSRVLEEPWTLITSVFLHADIDHLFFNMFALFIFGLYLESRVKEEQFLLIFFLAGILGNLAYLLVSPSSIIPAVGASGAIYGVMGTLAVLYPGLVVYFFGIAPMPMIFAAAIWGLMEFTGMFVPSNISHEAHLAGLIIGMLYGLYVKRERNKLVFFWET